jgi:hypothetical protein
MTIAYAPVGQSTGSGRLHHLKATYSFAVHGGTVGTIVVASGILPQGAAILAAYVEVNTIPVGATATIAVTTGQGADDIQAAAAISGAPWSTTGWKLSSARTFAAAPLETTAARGVSVVIGTANLTAGIFDVHVFFVMP